MDRSKVFAMKRMLYAALIEIPPDETTDDDLNLMVCLMKDSGIQGLFQSALSLESNAGLDPARKEG